MEYKQCVRCVMDNKGDPTIEFDQNGMCNYCTEALIARDAVYHPNVEGKKYLSAVFENLKNRRKGYKYDCMLGLSGGLDSSYVAYIGYTYGLRMLAVHIDDGFDTPVTKSNIKKICKAYNIDLIVEKPDEDAFNDLTASFIKADVPDIAIPQDNVLFAVLYKYAKENGIDCFLNGSNFALESILQKGNSHDASDIEHILAIWKKFGKNYCPQKISLMSTLKKRIYYGLLNKIETIKPLNYLEYNAENAFTVLSETCGYEYYGDKHCESILTKFMQRYYLPVKFNVDKRKSHYSSMIVSGQMSREHALKRLEEPLYRQDDLENDIDFVLSKLHLSKDEFNAILTRPPIQHIVYPVSHVGKTIQIILNIRKRCCKY